MLGQFDDGQKGQEVRLSTMLDEDNKTKAPDGAVCQVWIGLTYCGKQIKEVAEGMKSSLQLFVTPEP
jgi:hypothetical protein